MEVKNATLLETFQHIENARLENMMPTDVKELLSTRKELMHQMVQIEFELLACYVVQKTNNQNVINIVTHSTLQNKKNKLAHDLNENIRQLNTKIVAMQKNIPL